MESEAQFGRSLRFLGSIRLRVSFAAIRIDGLHCNGRGAVIARCGYWNGVGCTVVPAAEGEPLARCAVI